MFQSRQTRPVTPDGHVVIPWAIQRELGVEEGGAVCFVIENGAVSLHPADSRTKQIGPVETPHDRAVPWKRVRAELAKLVNTFEREANASPEIRWARAAEWADMETYSSGGTADEPGNPI